MNFHVVDVSGNTKVGPIPVTTSGRETCPTDCPLYDFCYASTGRLSIHWRKVSDGERAISYEQMLAKIADFYEAEVDAKIKALTSMIEPLMIIFVGIVVGFIVISMYLPIFSLYDKIR